MLEQTSAVTHTSHAGTVLVSENPMSPLLADGSIAKVGNGLFVIKGTLARILQIIDALVTKIAVKFSAGYVHVPAILSWENVLRSNYLDSFTNQALVVSTLPSEREAPAVHGEYEGLCSPTVCYHYFSSLKNKSAGPAHAVSALSKCSRKEAGELNDLGRLINFTMQEIIFLGSHEFCLKTREAIMTETCRVFNEVFDLRYDITTASDPFFGDAAELKKKAQLLSQAKYELQAFVPYKDDIVSIASFNVHGKVFFDRFGILPETEAATFSGCVGWGYERVLFAILSQKGTDFTSPYYQKLLNFFI